MLQFVKIQKVVLFRVKIVKNFYLLVSLTINYKKNIVLGVTYLSKIINTSILKKYEPTSLLELTSVDFTT